MHRRKEFRASKIMLDRARAQENIELLTPYAVKEFVPGESGALGHAALVNTETGEERTLEVSGAFVAVGHEPQSALVDGQIDVDGEGYVAVQGRSTKTNRPGVFGAGDLVDHTYRQAITAAGSGCQAALDAEWYLRDTPQVPTPEGMPVGTWRRRSGRPPRLRSRLGGGFVGEEAGATRTSQPACTHQTSAALGLAGSAPRGTPPTGLQHGQYVVESDLVGPREWSAWIVEPELMPVSMSCALPTPSPSAKAHSLITWQTIRSSTPPAPRAPPWRQRGRRSGRIRVRQDGRDRSSSRSSRARSCARAARRRRSGR